MQAILYGAMVATATAALTVTVAVAADRVTGPDNGFFNGNDVHKFCQQNIMLGYTAGLWDQMTHSAFVFEVVPHSGPPQMAKAEIEYGRQLLGVFCPPDGVTVQQATAVFCKYVRDTPEKRHTSGALLFKDAMTNAWPCK
jgi:hypothetical protein